MSGVRVDYLSPTLYLTDIPIFLLFILEIQNFKIKFKKSLVLLLLLTSLILFNIYFSLSPAVSVYKWLRVAEFGWLAYFVAKNNKFLLNSYKILLIPVFYESILAIWQFINQGSVGGFWYWLGERTFSSGTPGIANAYINGQLVLRPYGTFPHPNVLGGFLTVVLPLILHQFLHNSRKLTAQGFGVLLIVVLGYVTLFLSLSRAAILAGIGVTLLVLWQKFGRSKIWLGVLGCLVILGTVLWPRFGSLGAETESVVMRERLSSIAIEQFTHSPVLGQGLGTSPLFSSSTANYELRTTNYALAFQPPHNIYLLILAETGIMGVLGGLRVLRKIRLTLPLAAILILGLVDHYFLTLQQGQLLLALIVGLALVRIDRVLKNEGVSKDDEL